MFQTLPGFRAFYPEACAQRNALFQCWREAAERFGYEEFDGPLLEPLELLTAKSGQEIVGQLFHFEDKGGRQVSLRPEMTPTLARLVAARAGSLKRPVRWFSIGEHFRYEKQQRGRLRSFYQLNADILGEAGPAADAEMVALLIHVLVSLGLGAADFQVRLSDRTFWLALLALRGVNESVVPEVLGVIDKLERRPSEALVADLGSAGVGDPEGLLAAVRELAGCRELGALRDFFAGQGGVGELEAVFDRWTELLELLEAHQLGDFVRLDLGIVRGLAYYTGFVFEAFRADGEGRALAGGGRYDHLLEKLGGPAMPAVGFGMGDVTVSDLLEEKGLLPSVARRTDLYLVIGGQAERRTALTWASRLRASGCRVAYALNEAGFGKQMRQASQSGARLALIFGTEELAQGGVKVKRLETGEENLVAYEALEKAVADQLNPQPGN